MILARVDTPQGEASIETEHGTAMFWHQCAYGTAVAELDGTALAPGPGPVTYWALLDCSGCGLRGWVTAGAWLNG